MTLYIIFKKSNTPACNAASLLLCHARAPTSHRTVLKTSHLTGDVMDIIWRICGIFIINNSKLPTVAKNFLKQVKNTGEFLGIFFRLLVNVCTLGWSSEIFFWHPLIAFIILKKGAMNFSGLKKKTFRSFSHWLLFSINFYDSNDLLLQLKNDRQLLHKL